jgi:hypothetical protein
MSADYQLFQPIHAFALAAIQQSDPKLTADLSPLIAGLATCHPDLYADRLFDILQLVCSAISDPSCLNRNRPTLVKGVASIVKAFQRGGVATQLLANCLEPCLAADWKWDPADIEESNRMYQAIFKLLAVVICAGAHDEDFLAREGPNWVRMLAGFAQSSLFYAVDQTLKSYALLILRAVHLPFSGWQELIRIRIRLPLILGMLSHDPEVGKAAREAWNAFLPPTQPNPPTE